MNGSPDATWDGRLAYSPPQDAVQEVSVKAFNNRFLSYLLTPSGIQPNPVITECLRLMGAAATPLAFGEVYTALQAGVLDGVEHNPPTIVASKLYESAKFFTASEHIFGALACFVSDTSFKRMPANLRDGFLDATQKAAIDTRKRGLEAQVEGTEVLKQQGVTISECDVAAFRVRVLREWDKIEPYKARGFIAEWP